MRAIWELFVLSLQLFGKSKTILKFKIYSNKKGKSNNSHRLHHQLISLTSNPISHRSQLEPSTLPRWVFQGLTTQPPASTVLWAPTMRSSASLPPPFNTQDPTRLFGPRWGGPSSRFLPDPDCFLLWILTLLPSFPPTVFAFCLVVWLNPSLPHQTRQHSVAGLPGPSLCPCVTYHVPLTLQTTLLLLRESLQVLFEKLW